jgi:hypothetical protein
MFLLKKKIVDSIDLNMKCAKQFFVNKERKILINKVLTLKIKLDENEFN